MVEAVCRMFVLATEHGEFCSRERRAASRGLALRKRHHQRARSVISRLYCPASAEPTTRYQARLQEEKGLAQ